MFKKVGVDELHAGAFAICWKPLTFLQPLAQEDDFSLKVLLNEPCLYIHSCVLVVHVIWTLQW